MNMSLSVTVSVTVSVSLLLITWHRTPTYAQHCRTNASWKQSLPARPVLDLCDYEIYHTLADICNWRRQRHTWQEGGTSWGYVWAWGWGPGICMSARTYVQLSKLFIFSSLFLCWHLFTCVAINFLLRRVANWRRRVICAPAVDAVRPLAAGRWHTPAQVSAYHWECVRGRGQGAWAGHREVWLNVIWCEILNSSGPCVIYVNVTICVAYFRAAYKFHAKWKFPKTWKIDEI